MILLTEPHWYTTKLFLSMAAFELPSWFFLTQVVLIHVGVTSVIAHIKIGQMHAALESKVLVVSAQGRSAELYR